MSRSVTEDVTFLIDKIGLTLTAMLAGAPSLTLPDQWIRGGLSPTPVQVRRLDAAARLFETLEEREGADVARALFTGAWPNLGDTSPVEFLRRARTDVEFATVAAGARMEF